MLKLKSFLLKQTFSFNTSKKRNSIAPKKTQLSFSPKISETILLPKINKLTDLEKVLSKVKLIDLKNWKRNFACEVVVSEANMYFEKNLYQTCKTTSTSTRHEENMNAICRKYK